LKDIPKRSLKKVSYNPTTFNIVYDGAISSEGYRKNNFDLFKNIAQRKINIYIYGTYENINSVKDFILYSNNNKYFHFFGNLNPQVLLQELTKYDFGIIPNVCTKDNKLNEMMMPNKLFDYLSAKLPVLIKKSNMKNLESYVRKENIGLIYYDIEDLIKKCKLNKGKIKICPSKYVMENNISKIENFYKLILNNY
jgi:hypothetical protein